ncbi:hypothetical protein KKA08_10570, partial [bacterium]|nr:hypothetical protein [bacterium]
MNRFVLFPEPFETRFYALVNALCVICLTFLLTTTEIHAERPLLGDSGLSITSENATCLDLVYTLPGFQLKDFHVNDQTYQTVVMPGVILPHQAGAPNLPYLGRYIAV